MDDILVDKGGEAGISSESTLNNESESCNLARAEGRQRLKPQYRFRLNIREVKSEDIFYGGQMCE